MEWGCSRFLTTPPPQARAPPLLQPGRPALSLPCVASPLRLRAPSSRPPNMGSQGSKALRGDVTTEDAAGASPTKANGQENGHGAEAKGRRPQGDPKEEEEILFQEAFQIEWPVLQEKSEGGWGDSSASSPTEEEQEQGETGASSEEGTAQEGKAAATRESQEPQAKGSAASAASKGGDTEEEAGPQAAEPPSGPESGPTLAGE
ncbi:MARCKS-related protein [Galemys pyrenaicus]|uniref:MARCKS-related protein n=1 Tax=Galemys pyrenaicus TaxID=202257 RepID=A0A8J6AIS9_GALPY|nr:MARCKS-related protein [Galemys pyrenaicus]